MLGEVFLKYHLVIRQPSSLYLDSFIANEYWLFSPGVFPRSYHPIPKLPKPEICAEHTDFFTR